MVVSERDRAVPPSLVRVGGFKFSHLREQKLRMFAHIILASASTASSQMSAKHQENDTPVKASHLLLVDCGVSSSGSRTLSVGGAPQAREICVVPPEQCGVVTLCDLPTAEGQGSPLPIPWLVQWLIIPVWMRQVFSDRPARL